MTRNRWLPGAWLGLLLLASAAHAQDVAGRGHQHSRLPPTPKVEGPLAVTVVYPAAGQLLEVRDSTFLFGSVGDGRATLTLNGERVPVHPNGAWLAWVSLPDDSAFSLRLQASRGADTVTVLHPLRRPPHRMRGPGLWLDSASMAPRGALLVGREEWIALSVRAAPEATVVLRLPDGTSVPLRPEHAADDVPDGIRAFDRDARNLVAPSSTRFVGLLRGRDVPLDQAMLVATLGADSVVARWRAQVTLLDTLPQVVEFNDDTAGRGDTDSLTIGRAVPGGTYHWFFPTGTRALVTGRRNGDLRVQLSARAEAWVPAADARPLPRGTAPPRAIVGSITTTPDTGRLVVRVPLSQRVPFRVDERERGIEVTLYAARGDADWVRYGPPDPDLASLTWSQPVSDEVHLDLSLRRAVWGWRTRWSGTDLILEVRRPPRIDARRPLRGRFIAIDPGHPPAGATGPTGLREAEATLAVAQKVATLLRRAGARVLLTREADVPVELLPRLKLVERADAELLVSIHGNALPDGVNPFTNNGTSTFFNHPRAIPLAAALDRELVRRFGERDLGVARGDLALVRPTWFPAALTEGLFLMVPEHEAALRSAAGQARYAEGVVAGIVAFLRARAAER